MIRSIWPWGRSWRAAESSSAGDVDGTGKGLEIGMELSRLYRRNWLVVALSVWLGTLALYFIALPFVALGGGLFVIEAMHHLSLFSPFLAWEVARDVVRKATLEAPGGGWMLARAAPRWTLWLGVGYAAL